MKFELSDDELRRLREESQSVEEQLRVGLKKNFQKNESIINIYGKSSILEWAALWTTKFKGADRAADGDKLFEAKIRVLASFNSLMWEMSKDNLDTESCFELLTIINHQRNIIENIVGDKTNTK